MAALDTPIASLPMAALGLAIVLIFVLWLIGINILFAWGSYISFRQAGAVPKGKSAYKWLKRIGWPTVFFILPGYTHVAYSFFESTSVRFRVLAWGVSLGLIGGLLLLRLYVAIL